MRTVRDRFPIGRENEGRQKKIAQKYITRLIEPGQFSNIIKKSGYAVLSILLNIISMF